jgi:hypothetical protein
VEFFNEAVIMLTLYSFFGFTPFVADLSIRVYVGFYCSFVVSMHMIINLFLITFDTFRGTLFSFRIWYALRTKTQAQLSLQQKRADAKTLRRSVRITRKKQESDEFTTIADLQENSIVSRKKPEKGRKATRKRKNTDLQSILEVEPLFEDVSEAVPNMQSNAEATRWNENEGTQVDGAYIRNALRQKRRRRGK